MEYEKLSKNKRACDLALRNSEIVDMWKDGFKEEYIAKQYKLSVATIKKIVNAWLNNLDRAPKIIITDIVAFEKMREKAEMFDELTFNQFEDYEDKNNLVTCEAYIAENGKLKYGVSVYEWDGISYEEKKVATLTHKFKKWQQIFHTTLLKRPEHLKDMIPYSRRVIKFCLEDETKKSEITEEKANDK